MAEISPNESSSPFMGGDVAPKGALEFKLVRGAINISSLRDFDEPFHDSRTMPLPREFPEV